MVSPGRVFSNSHQETENMMNLPADTKLEEIVRSFARSHEHWDGPSIMTFYEREGAELGASTVCVLAVGTDQLFETMKAVTMKMLKEGTVPFFITLMFEVWSVDPAQVQDKEALAEDVAALRIDGRSDRSERVVVQGLAMDGRSFHAYRTRGDETVELGSGVVSESTGIVETLVDCATVCRGYQAVVSGN
jgi:hypothetical protein